MSRKPPYSVNVQYDQETEDALAKVTADLFPQELRSAVVEMLLRESLEKLGYLKPPA